MSIENETFHGGEIPRDFGNAVRAESAWPRMKKASKEWENASVSAFENRL
jgi:hypothetical protein